MSREVIKAELKPDKVDGNTGEIIETIPTVHEVAQKLAGYMEKKPKKIMFNGLRFPEFDDWQSACLWLPEYSILCD